MLKQEYKSKAILSVINKKDVRRWNLWSKDEDKYMQSSNIADNLIRKKYTINPLKKYSYNRKDVYLPTEVEDFLSLKLVDRYLRRVYKVIQSDRNKIIRQIKLLLEDEGNFVIIRQDIKSFYESIDFEKCLFKIKNDMILSPKGLNILISLKDRYFNVKESKIGIPRGIGVSATLSELYLRDLDNTIKEDDNVIYYSRYVDDIFIVADKDKKQNIVDLINKKIENLNLSFNMKKCQFIDTTNNYSFEYLGYLFKIVLHNNGKKKISVQIAPSKVDKIKQRIYKSFLDYNKKRDFPLLLNRLRYLSCNKIIKKTENGNLIAGNSYNYCNITDNSCIKVFDKFICEKMSLFNFNPSQHRKISKISFYRAFKDKKMANFTKKQIKYIKKIWAYE